MENLQCPSPNLSAATEVTWNPKAIKDTKVGIVCVLSNIGDFFKLSSSITYRKNLKGKSYITFKG